ncbi:hypothetical protein PCC9214_03986 [Planktothrix tepida]|uniref:Uncharacterized protein n=1 Tax=Planktothrix tepida PCC 9214 TaxID=671072 RepID=A0A1J1LPR7_9CYAN|nr:hypothetical protein [Planktothrix tepida]CAD5973534.1 hypothetical protein PCC9214_03986 [Planktothrix tepida]CUR34415.1 hypothetical protein PL9214640422 [Planktothrix tepida PCC 9214]
MYRKDEQPRTPAEDFKLPFEGKLSEENRWVIMAKVIPWEEFEAEYEEPTSFLKKKLIYPSNFIR